MGTERFELSSLAAYASEAYAYTSSATCPHTNIANWCGGVPVIVSKRAGLAQLVERFIYTEDARGSSPLARTLS